MYAVETKGLTKYYGKSRGIIDVNLSIHEGEIFGFIGPNGAGKSTTIRILLNLLYAQSGTGRIFDLDIARDSKKIKRLIGYMPAEIDYYNKMSVLEFLKYSANFYGMNCDTKINELAELFQIDLKRKILDLSLGNKKKVSILQSLIHSPKLLILDEPTSGLDPLMQAKFFDLLAEENKQGTTIFFSSHILSEVQRMCQRVAIIKDGRVVQVEEVSNLRHKQLKKVSIETKANIQPLLAKLNGVSNLTNIGSKLSFIFTGDFNELISILNGRDVQNLQIEESSLEEIFMHYYTDVNRLGDSNNER